MKVEKQLKRSSSHILQSVQENTPLSFIDNRTQTAIQTKLIKSIQNIIQRRPLNYIEQAQLKETQQYMKELWADKADLLDTFAKLKDYGDEDDMSLLKKKMDSLSTFYNEIDELYKRAHMSSSDFNRYHSKINMYQFSGGKNIIKNILFEIKRRDKKFISNERTELNQITGMDEKIFEQYLRTPKQAVIVYRGDGRGVKADFLENYIPHDIIAGGEADISFYGVVQHTFSNTNKNGMVSTTTDQAQAKDWAIDKNNFGVVYTIELTNYIDVNYIFRQRNFKNRYTKQKEIMAPGNISATDIKSVTLYDSKSNILGSMAV